MDRCRGVDARLLGCLLDNETNSTLGQWKPCGRQIPISLLVAIGAIGRNPNGIPSGLAIASSARQKYLT